MTEIRPTSQSDGGTTRWLLRLFIFALTFAAFASGLSGEFVNWDDDANIVYNEGIREFDAEHVGWMFTTFHGGHYQPLSWFSLALDHAVWGLKPFGFHLTNLLLHCLASVLFFDVALILLAHGFKKKDPADCIPLHRAALIAALLFSIHPLRVESVSWVTERRDVLSGVFVMLTVLGYLRHQSWTGVGWLFFSWLMFALTLMTKASAVPLPLVLLIIDAFPLRRLQMSKHSVTIRVIEKIPYIVCSITASVLAIKAQAAAQAWQSIRQFDLASRFAALLYSLCWYPMKFLVPTKLCAFYPIPERAQLLGTSLAISAIIVIVAAIVLLLLRRKWPAVLGAAVAYALLLGPVSGIAQSGEQLVADRYGYLSLLPFAILVAAALHKIKLNSKDNPSRKSFATLLRTSMVVYLAGLFGLTVFQATTWADSLTLWNHALRVGVESNIAHVNFAEKLRELGEHRLANQHYERAAQLDPSDAKALNGMGITALRVGRPDEALRHLERAIEINPTHAKYQFNIAELYAGYGRLKDAADHYRAAIDSAPCFVQAIGRLAAVEEAAGQFAAAKATLEQGVACPNGNAGLEADLAWLLATCPEVVIRDGQRAVALATELCERTAYRDPMALSTLAVAYAESQMYDRAIATQLEAIRLASEHDDAGMLVELRRRHALFKGHQKYAPPLANPANQP